MDKIRNNRVVKIKRVIYFCGLQKCIVGKKTVLDCYQRFLRAQGKVRRRVGEKTEALWMQCGVLIKEMKAQTWNRYEWKWNGSLFSDLPQRRISYYEVHKVFIVCVSKIFNV